MGLRKWIQALSGRQPQARPVAEIAELGALAAELRSYDGAARSRRTQGWRTSASGANEEVGAALDVLRQRARDSVRNNAHASKAVSSIATAVIGSGLHPRVATGSDELDRRVESLWGEWSQDAESSGVLDWPGLQLLAARALVESGEVLVRRRARRLTDGLAVPLQLQILESDYLDESKDEELPNGFSDVQGVRFDGRGARVGYWLHASHPGERQGTTGDAVLVRASDVAHLYEVLRPGQVRGVPWLAPVLIALRTLDEWIDAEAVRKRIEACVAAFVTGADEGDESIGPSAVDSDGATVESLEPGLIAYLHGGKQVTFSHPQAMGGYSEHLRADLHAIAAGARIPYEILTGDLSQTNYSSIRAGLIDFQRLVAAIQSTIFVRSLCRPVWRWWTEAAIVAGLLPDRAYPVQWTRPVVESLDREKEAKADLAELLLGSATLADVVARRTGRTLEEHLGQVAAGQRLAAELGLAFDSDVSAGRSPAAPTLDDEPEIQPVDDGDGDSPASQADGEDVPPEEPTT